MISTAVWRRFTIRTIGRRIGRLQSLAVSSIFLFGGGTGFSLNFLHGIGSFLLIFLRSHWNSGINNLVGLFHFFMGYNRLHFSSKINSRVAEIVGGLVIVTNLLFFQSTAGNIDKATVSEVPSPVDSQSALQNAPTAGKPKIFTSILLFFERFPYFR